MLLDKLRKQRAEIIAAGRRYGARRIRVFGSVARGEERPDSDIDFLVDFP
ncbi:MAG: nucleotidyltransferase domain-containing protein, partial [Candidatus Competibacter sp.]|nr:nucleotidyltransferase domain-containing protein [Candidatus Competibacter sp.]